MTASKGFFAGVGEFMSLQMALGDKLLVALAAHKRPLACVSPHVSFEVTRL